MVADSREEPCNVTLICQCGDLLGEGPLWDHRQGRLLWIDILRGVVHSWRPTGELSEVLHVDALLGSIALCGKSDLLLATSRGLMIWRSDSGQSELLANPIENKPVRFNDGRVDSYGRFWVGTMALDANRYDEPLGALYRVDRSGESTPMEQGLTIANGIDWSPDDRTMYLTDTMRRAIYAYDFNSAAGTIHNRRTIAETPAHGGYPDGLTVDAAGDLWSAGFGGGGIFQYDSSGNLLRKIHTPVSCPTALTFGGPGHTKAFITTSRHALADGHRERSAGALFAIDLSAHGRAAVVFGAGG